MTSPGFWQVWLYILSPDDRDIYDLPMGWEPIGAYDHGVTIVILRHWVNPIDDKVGW